ncbi:MAG: 30S ribosomal protein S8 [Candidatus Pacebacteria bacterium]|nr:30S ribosomal protein S8 [Candidatus Paceibacterota bacterium]
MNLDLLTKIKNAQAVKKESVKVKASKTNEAILDVLKKRHYIDSFSAKSGSRTIEVKLKYQNNQGAVHGIKILSKPSRSLYAGYKDIDLVKQGYGFLILSTPKGILDGKVARKEKVGGQLLFEIW